MAKVVLRDVFTISPRNPIVFDDPSLTDQSQASSCDLQTIIDWHSRSGSWVMPNQKLRPQAPALKMFLLMLMLTIRMLITWLLRPKGLYDFAGCCSCSFC